MQHMLEGPARFHGQGVSLAVDVEDGGQRAGVGGGAGGGLGGGLGGGRRGRLGSLDREVSMAASAAPEATEPKKTPAAQCGGGWRRDLGTFHRVLSHT